MNITLIIINVLLAGINLACAWANEWEDIACFNCFAAGLCLMVVLTILIKMF